MHHVDLGLAYAPADWPAGLVERMLPELLADLPGRTDAAGLAGWLLPRAGTARLGRLGRALPVGYRPR